MLLNEKGRNCRRKQRDTHYDGITSSPCCVQLSVAVTTMLASASSLANRSTDATHCVHGSVQVCGVHVQCVYITMRRFFEHVSASSPLTGTFDLTHRVLGLEVVDYDGA